MRVSNSAGTVAERLVQTGGVELVIAVHSAFESLTKPEHHDGEWHDREQCRGHYATGKPDWQHPHGDQRYG